MMHPMMGMGGTGGKVSLLLMALAAGYAVLVLANKQGRPLDVLGRILGALILLVSSIGLVCMAACSLKCKMGSCGPKSAAMCDSGPKKDCPFAGAASAGTTTPPSPQ